MQRYHPALQGAHVPGIILPSTRVLRGVQKWVDAGLGLPGNYTASVRVRKGSATPGAVDIYYLDGNQIRYRSKSQVRQLFTGRLVSGMFSEQPPYPLTS